MSDRDILLPDGWPRPSGYSNGIATPAGRLVFVAGQIGWNPLTSRFDAGDFSGQVRQALINIVAVLRAGGAEPRHLVRVTWYITDRTEYESSLAAIGQAWRELIGPHYPTMTLIIVAGLLERQAKVEIEATAVVGM